jgi:cytochrome P450
MTQVTVDLNLNAQEVVDDPYPHYEVIRGTGRAVMNGLLGVWMIPGHADVLSVLHDPSTFSSGAFASADTNTAMRGSPNMIMSDPPEQQRLRKVAQQAFSRRSVRTIEAAVGQIVDEVLDTANLADRWAAGETADVMDALCRPVPATVIARLLGVPSGDTEMFVAWSEDMSNATGEGREQFPDWPEVKARADDAGTAMRAYLEDQIEQHRRTEHDDLINDLLVANEHGVLDDGELIATLVLLLIAGNETTTKLIGTGLLLLDQHPDQRRQLVANPDLVASAVEEMLRFQGVVHMLPRMATRDFEMGDSVIRSDEIVLLLLAAANRDPDAFADPNRFDITRTPNHHVGFGHGIHHCLGNMVARMEARIALSGFLSRFPDYQVKEYRYRPVFLARGLGSLVISRD